MFNVIAVVINITFYFYYYLQEKKAFAKDNLLILFLSTGVRSVKACLLLPVATGMTLVMTLLTLKQTRPGAKFVIWPRIDQKSCFKCILTAGKRSYKKPLAILWHVHIHYLK